MDVLTIVGIALSVYLFAPLLIFSIEFAIKKANKSVQLEFYPVASTLTHIVVSVFLIVGLFLNAVWGYVVWGIFYFIKLIAMSFTMKEISYASNTRSERSTQQFLQDLRKVRPLLSIYVRCWHTEVYYTTEHYTDSNGHRCSRQERHERQVTTYTETRYVQITGWYDQTGALVLPEHYRQHGVISLHLHKAIDYYKNSRSVIQMMMTDAYNQNKFRDVCCETRLNRTIPGLTEYNYLAQKLPFYMQKWAVICALLLMLDCPLLLHIRARTPHCQLVVRKVVSLLPNQRRQDETGQVPFSPPDISPTPSMNPLTPIAPPAFSTNIDQITPPIEIMTNTQPLFIDQISAPSDFDKYRFDDVEPPSTGQAPYTVVTSQ